MFKASCPGCGAEVAFRSPASVMAVCEYCQTTLLRDADSVKDLGKMSAVLEDYTVLQIGTSGQYQGRNFSLVGRIQLRYEDGFWNEWYAWFDDGSAGWLSDASGQYVFTLDRGTVPGAPDFAGLSPGAVYSLDGKAFYAADVREARCVAGQGELPFAVGQGWVARVADFRETGNFLTLDYSEGDVPRCYVGTAVSPELLKCQLLRSDDEIARSAGKLKGTVSALDCPACGSPIQQVAGAAAHLVCPSCHAEVTVDGGRALVLQKHQQLQSVKTTLSLGDKASIDGKSWLLIGLMRCREVDEAEVWTEYLLYNPVQGFLWLVESDSGWERVEVLNEWPVYRGTNAVVMAGAAYTKTFTYGAEVLYAAGAFNWRVKIGDRTGITDYAKGGTKLTEERTGSEINWSRAQKVTAERVANWFGLAAPVKAGGATGGEPAGRSWATRYAWIMTGFLLFSNFLPLFFANNAFWVLIAALVMIWVPTGYLNRMEGDE